MSYPENTLQTARPQPAHRQGSPLEKTHLKKIRVFSSGFYGFNSFNQFFFPSKICPFVDMKEIRVFTKSLPEFYFSWYYSC
jgi:hypothetical protein